LFCVCGYNPKTLGVLAEDDLILFRWNGANYEARPMRPVMPAEFLVLLRRVVLLREPHDRFEATWRNYCQRRDVRLTFGELVEAALGAGFPFKTPELDPQVGYCALANHLIRWDFAELLGVALLHERSHSPIQSGVQKPGREVMP
jgi:hypothetical protein